MISQMKNYINGDVNNYVNMNELVTQLNYWSVKDMSVLKDKKIISPDLGLTETELEGINVILMKLLADEYTIYTKARKYHWNVTGQNFAQYHQLFEDQYNQTNLIVDEVAEYIREYGAMSPGTLTEFKELTRLDEKPGNNPPAEEMVASLLADHEQIVRNLREDAETVINKYNDPQVEDLLIGYIHQHQKMAWFLRAHLEGPNE